MSASPTELGTAGSMIVAVPILEPCPIDIAWTLYSVSWSINGLTTTSSKKAFSCRMSCMSSCQAAPQNKVNTCTDVSNGPPL